MPPLFCREHLHGNVVLKGSAASEKENLLFFLNAEKLDDFTQFRCGSTATLWLFLISFQVSLEVNTQYVAVLGLLDKIFLDEMS